MEYDRPRGILTQADREFLISDKSGYTRQQQYNARSRIRERIINAFLDMVIIENHLSAEERKEIFDSFDASKTGADRPELYSDIEDHVTCLTKLLAFIYRETREENGRHPYFALILEQALHQGQAEPGAELFGRYNVSIEVEEVIPEKIDIKRIATLIEEGRTDELSEGEVMTFVQIATEAGEIDPETVEETFEEMNEEYKEKYGGYAGSIKKLLAGHPSGQNL